VSWTEGLDLSTADLSTQGAVNYARGAIIAAGAAAGASTYAVAKVLRQNGIGLRITTVRDTLAAVAEQVNSGRAAGSLPLDASAGELLSGAPPPNWTGQYVHQVTATFRTKDAEGNFDLYSTTRSVVSNVPLSPYEAGQAALQILTEQSNPNYPEEQPGEDDVVSMALTGVYYRTSRGPTGQL
jgi:hypothetical protein